MLNLTDAGLLGAAQVVLTIAGVAVKDFIKDKKAQAKAEAIIASAQKVAPEAVTLGEEALHAVGKVFREVVHAPEVAAKVAPLQHALSVDLQALKTSKLYTWAGVAINAHLKQFEAMTPDEIATAIQYVKAKIAKDADLVKAGVNSVEEGDVLGAMKDIAGVTQDFIHSDLFQQTQALQATKAKLAAEPAPDTTTTPAAAPATTPEQPAQ